MACKKYKLYEACIRLQNLSDACEHSLCNECQQHDLTHRQLYYLRIIDTCQEMTFSRLATLTNNSKPTITELVNRLIAQDCVYKQKSSKDKRVCYIYLTEKGKKLARLEGIKQMRIVEHINECLSEDEISCLIELLNKL